MAIFKFKYGVMTAGKSQELLRTHYNYKNKGEEVLVIVPSYERKDGIGIVQSRAGGLLSANSVMPGELKTWLKNILKKRGIMLAFYLMKPNSSLKKIYSP